MYNPLSENTRVVNVPGTDTILQLMRKKDRTYILPLSKEELRGSPDSWKNPAISGTLLYSTLFIWASVLSPVAFPLLLLGSPVFILATVIGMKGINNLLLTDPVQEEPSVENDRDFNSTTDLPEINVEKNLLNSSDKEIIETYRETMIVADHQKEVSYINDRTFSELFKEDEKESVNDPVFVDVEATVENKTWRNS